MDPFNKHLVDRISVVPLLLPPNLVSLEGLFISHSNNAPFVRIRHLWVGVQRKICLPLTLLGGCWSRHSVFLWWTRCFSSGTNRKYWSFSDLFTGQNKDTLSSNRCKNRKQPDSSSWSATCPHVAAKQARWCWPVCRISQIDLNFL